MIRLATLEDRDSLDEAYSKYLDHLLTPPDPILLDYEKVAASGQTYVIDNEGLICGMVTCTEEPKALVMRNLAVLPAHQCKGVGRRLATFVEEEALRRHRIQVRLWTRTEMEDNIRFYLRLGYDITHRELSKECSRVFLTKTLDVANVSGTEHSFREETP